MGTILQNALLVQLDPPSVQYGTLRQEAGEIVLIEVAHASDRVPQASARLKETRRVSEADQIIDCQGEILLPGMINGHTHLYSALAAGMPAPPRSPRNFHEILQQIWWRLDRAHNPDSIRMSGLVGALAAIRCGTTTLIDHHASPSCIEGSLDFLRDGIAQAGCRAVLCYEVTDRNRPDEATEGLAENGRFIQACHDAPRNQFAGMVGGHASFTMSDNSLRDCVAACQEWQVGFHIHVAEDPIDEEITRRQFGVGLMQRLRALGVLDVPDTIFAHGTHLEPDAIAVINDRPQIALAHNPNSNMNNGVGYAPVARFARPPMLGTDGIGADLWREARAALFKSNDAHKSIGYESPLRMLGQSAGVASTCLGVRLGRLEEGAAADLVLTDYVPATPLSAENLAGHLIYAMGPEYVRSVMIDGRWRLVDRQFVDCDERNIRRQSVEISSQLHQRMASL